MTKIEEYTYALATPDGRIHQVLSGPYWYVRCDRDVRDVTHYVDPETKIVKPKEKLDFTVSVDGMDVTLSGLPEGLTLRANGHEGETDAYPLHITFDVPGQHTVYLYGGVRYLDATLEVDVGNTERP